MEALRHDKLKRVPHHLIRLAGRNTRLQGQKVLSINARSLGQHLAPAVLQRRFDAQHGQPGRIEGRVGVFRRTGEQEIGLRIALRPRAALVTDAEGGQHRLDVVLKGQTHAALAAILDRQRELQEAVHIGGAVGQESRLKARGDDVALKAAEQGFLELDPRQQGGVCIIARIDGGKRGVGQRREVAGGREGQAEAADDLVQPICLGFFRFDADFFEDIVADEIQTAIRCALEPFILEPGTQPMIEAEQPRDLVL